MRNEFNTGIQTVDVKTSELIAKLIENKVQHGAEYAEAVRGWKEDRIVEMKTIADGLEACAALLKTQAGLNNSAYTIEAPPRVYTSLQEPKHHLKEYIHVIAMMEASVNSEQTLTSEQFAKYWQDEWEWTEAFKMSTERYMKRGPIGG